MNLAVSQNRWLYSSSKMLEKKEQNLMQSLNT